MNRPENYNEANILFAVIGTSVQELRYARSVFAAPEWAASLFLLCGKKNRIEHKRALEDALDRYRNVEMVIVLATPGDNHAMEQALVLSETAKKRNIFSFVVTEHEAWKTVAYRSEELQEIEKLRSHTESLLFIPDRQPKEKRFLEYLCRKWIQKKNFYKNINHFLAFIDKLNQEKIIIRIDLDDIRYILKNAGFAFWATGKAEGKDRANLAAKVCIDSIPRNVLSTAKKVMIHLGIPKDIDWDEVENACTIVEENLHPDARVIFGAAFLEAEIEGEIDMDVLFAEFDLSEAT